LRLGIGRQAGQEAIQQVLGHFTPAEQPVAPKILEAACHGFRLFQDNKNDAARALKITQEFINSFRLVTDTTKNSLGE
jgi:peptidyl-tRNA hydrolase